MNIDKAETRRHAWSVAACVLLASNAAGAFDLREKLRLPKVEKPTSVQPANITEPARSGALATAGCPQSTPPKLSMLEEGKALLARKALDKAAEGLAIGEIQLPAQIENICQATKRLTYVERQTGRWSSSVIDAITQAKEALAISGEAQSYAAFKNNPDFSSTSDKNLSRLQSDLKSDLSAIEAAIAEKRAANAEKLEEARANMRAALAQGALIGGWDRRLVEYMGDNPNWAFRTENLKNVRMFSSHVELLGSTLTSVGSVVKAGDAATPDEKSDSKKAEEIRKQREKENAEYEKQLLAELQL